MKQTNQFNQKVANLLLKIGKLLRIKGVRYKPASYERAARSISLLEKDLRDIYKKKGLKGLEDIDGVGKSIASKIEEYIKRGRLKYLEELERETAVRQIIAHYFETKGVDLEELKRNARKRKIVYSRYTRPAKELLELAGSVRKAIKAIDVVAEWAKSRGLDYAIETVFKKWLELDRLKPKEIVKKPFYEGRPMVFSQTKKKWYVINDNGEWLEFAGEEDDIEWRITN